MYELVNYDPISCNYATDAKHLNPPCYILQLKYYSDFDM